MMSNNNNFHGQSRDERDQHRLFINNQNHRLLEEINLLAWREIEEFERIERQRIQYRRVMDELLRRAARRRRYEIIRQELQRQEQEEELHDFIYNASCKELRKFAANNGYYIDINGKPQAMSHIANRMRKSELIEYLTNQPHIPDTVNPSWFDRFCEIQENVGSIANNVSKVQLERLTNGFIAIEESYTMQDIYSLSFCAFNLRTLLAKMGRCKINFKLLSTRKYCKMLGLKAPKWGYTKYVICWARYCGFRGSSSECFEFLGIQRYPKTIREYLHMDVHQFNEDVQRVRENIELFV